MPYATMYHIGLTETDSAKYAILPGDPARVETIANHLENPSFVTTNREFTTFSGTLNGEKVLVTSTGIGGPSAAICVEELYKIGVRYFLRIGTCGAMQQNIVGGDIVIANGAIRMDGTSKEYMPIEFPAISDFSVTSALVNSAKALNKTYHIGVVQSKDSFYGQHSPERMPISYELENKWQAWIKCGAMASEMETSTIFCVAASLGAKAGAVLSVVWNQERDKAGLSDVHNFDTSSAIEVAIGAMREIINGK